MYDNIKQFWTRYGNTFANSITWKLIVFDAVIRTKLLYGLESAQLNESAKKKLDTFQLKGLRNILKLKTTFIDRSNTNEEVFRRANET